MSTIYEQTKAQLQATPRKWLITGVAGFIGSHLLEALLRLDQEVVGVDNFSSGYRKNLLEVQQAVTESQWRRFSFVDGDVAESIARRCEGEDRGGGREGVGFGQQEDELRDRR